MLSKPEDEISDAWKAVGKAYDGYDELRLAVSGGPDSLAMLVGFVRLRDAGLMDVFLEVVTVDHGLRTGSADEAQMVADICNRLGVACHVAQLAPSDDIKNKQAWARTERYKKLAELGDTVDPPVLTAHTAEDQAETLLMRAARGAGSEGLAGIRSPVSIAGAYVYRPFLNWRRDDLHAVLQGTPWQPAQDPSNEDEAYTRVRFRRWLVDAPAPDSDRSVVQGLAETARIAQLESAALSHYAQELVAGIGGAERGFVRGHLAFRKKPLAVQARFLRKALALVARLSDLQVHSFNASFDLARMVKLAERMEVEPAGRWVGGGAVLDWCHEGPADAHYTQITAFAEAGRTGFPQIEVGAGDVAIWDGRFEVNNWSSHTIVIRAWTSADPLPPLDDDMPPNAVLASLPVAVQDDEVVAWAGVPSRQECYQSGLPALEAVRRDVPS